MARIHHAETHGSQRGAWLRAAVLGANDGIVSVASLVLGVAGSGATQSAVLVAGVAGLVAGALSMAAGEYVSVGTQRDAEQADRAREAAELATEPDRELEELQGIYVQRGLDSVLALEVAKQLTEHDALGAHLRDELGIDQTTMARPTQAAVVSALSFAVGAVGPVITGSAISTSFRIPATFIAALLLLLGLGSLGASLGRSGQRRAVIRVFVGGGIAMLVSYGVGSLVGVAA